ncbi:hypothetical protein QC762_702224 [Podospora pseudocomata]|uniref:Uncharacterized protein n=1 Tax=Podospora pseudocomata TaxID=2093779 RepID=A0ABR0G302_9PEZI|nr:hypothetical protein QC762_702224 [Podospora pseudocomata]
MLPSSPSLLLLLLLLTALLLLLPLTTAQTTTPPTPTAPPTPTVTKIISLFYLNDRAHDDFPRPYTPTPHAIPGRVIATDSLLNLTTYIVTKTQSFPGRRRPPFGNNPPPWAKTLTLPPSSLPTPWWRPNFGDRNGTGQPITITQGPSTFMFTGSRGWEKGQSVVNRCSLGGTTEAVCNLTHVGRAWYTGDREWEGEYSTYSYTWTEGDRFGFVGVTVTAGGEMLSEENGGDDGVGTTGKGDGVRSANGGVGRRGVNGGVMMGWVVWVVMGLLGGL